MEVLLTSESNGVALHMEINWPWQFSASSVRRVSAEVNRILNSAACHAPITTSIAQGSYCSHAPCLALLLAWVGTEESGRIFRSKEILSFSFCLSSSPSLSLSLNLSLSPILLSFRDDVHSDINIAVSSKSFQYKRLTSLQLWLLCKQTAVPVGDPYRFWYLKHMAHIV